MWQELEWSLAPDAYWRQDTWRRLTAIFAGPAVNLAFAFVLFTTLFLVASAAERAQRRYNQLKEKDSGVSLAALSREIAARDRQDQSRPVSPLVPAGDAIVVDSTTLGVTEVVDRVWQLGRQRELWE